MTTFNFGEQFAATDAGATLDRVRTETLNREGHQLTLFRVGFVAVFAASAILLIIPAVRENWGVVFVLALLTGLCALLPWVVRLRSERRLVEIDNLLAPVANRALDELFRAWVAEGTGSVLVDEEPLDYARGGDAEVRVFASGVFSTANGKLFTLARTVGSDYMLVEGKSFAAPKRKPAAKAKPRGKSAVQVSDNALVEVQDLSGANLS